MKLLLCEVITNHFRKTIAQLSSRTKKSKTDDASAEKLKLWLDTQEKANNFLKSRKIKVISNRTRFFEISDLSNDCYQWLAISEDKSTYYTFDIKGQQFRYHKSQPKFKDICQKKVIEIFGKRYRVIDDVKILLV